MPKIDVEVQDWDGRPSMWGNLEVENDPEVGKEVSHYYAPKKPPIRFVVMGKYPRDPVPFVLKVGENMPYQQVAKLCGLRN